MSSPDYKIIIAGRGEGDSIADGLRDLTKIICKQEKIDDCLYY